MEVVPPPLSERHVSCGGVIFFAQSVSSSHRGAVGCTPLTCFCIRRPSEAPGPLRGASDSPCFPYKPVGEQSFPRRRSALATTRLHPWPEIPHHEAIVPHPSPPDTLPQGPKTYPRLATSTGFAKEAGRPEPRTGQPRCQASAKRRRRARGGE